MIDAAHDPRSRFEPRIVAFCCNWCAYSGADLCGVSRFQYPPNIRIIRVMCTGRIEPTFVLKAFKAGMDGVLVMGCHIGDCHYISGNLNAQVQMAKAFELCQALGLSKERMSLEWVSASEGMRFSQLVSDFTEKIRALGPTGYGCDDGIGRDGDP